MLPVPGPGFRKPFSDQHLVNAFPVLVVDVVQNPTISILLPRAELHPHRITGQLPEPFVRLVEARLSTLWCVDTEQPDPGVGALEGVTATRPPIKRGSPCITLM